MSNITNPYQSFGLQDAALKAFLLSPLGKTIKAFAQKKAEELLFLETAARNQAQKEAFNRTLRVLGLKLRKKEREKTQKNNNELLELYLLRQKQEQEQLKKYAKEPDPARIMLIEIYGLISKDLDFKVFKLSQIEKEIEACQSYMHTITDKYLILRRSLEDVESFLNQKPSPEELAARLNTLREELNIHLDHSEIQPQLLDTKGKIPLDISLALLPQLKPQHPHFPIMQLHLKAQFLHQALKIQQNKRTLYTAEGQITASIQNAAFIMKKNMQLFIDPAGNRYLFAEDRSFGSLNMKEKLSAQRLFNESLPRLMVTRHALQETQHQENKSSSLQLKKLQTQQRQLNSEINSIRMHLTEIEKKLQAKPKVENKKLPLLTAAASTQSVPKPNIVQKNSHPVKKPSFLEKKEKQKNQKPFKM